MATTETKDAKAMMANKVSVPNKTAHTHGAPETPGNLKANSQGTHREMIAGKDQKSKSLAQLMYGTAGSHTKPVGPVGPT